MSNQVPDAPRRRFRAGHRNIRGLHPSCRHARLPEYAKPGPFESILTKGGSLQPGTYFKAGVTQDSHLHEVFLDGAPVANCLEARADLGWVECYLLNASGEIVRQFDGPQTHRMYGQVEIRRLD